MTDTANILLTLLPENTLDPAAGINTALVDLDALLGCIHTGVVAVLEDNPPGAPADGDLYIVGAGTGDWSGEDNNLAAYVADGAFWRFYTAGVQVGLVRNLADSQLYVWHGSDGWVLYPFS